LAECGGHGFLLDRWLPQHEIEEDTRESYESLIRIFPASSSSYA
jgi:hypothetical protein